MLIEEYCKVFVQSFFDKGFKLVLKDKSAIGYDEIYIKDMKYPFVNKLLKITVYPKLTLKNKTYFRVISWIDSRDVYTSEQARVLTDRWYELQKTCEEINKLPISEKDLKNGKFKSYVEYASKLIYK